MAVSNFRRIRARILNGASRRFFELDGRLCGASKGPCFMMEKDMTLKGSLSISTVVPVLIFGESTATVQKDMVEKAGRDCGNKGGEKPTDLSA
jgi:hypothetical protein